MHGAVFWCALPFVLPQALQLRRAAPRFEPAAGPVQGEIGQGEPLRLLAVGDSIISGVGAPTLEDALVGRVSAELAGRLGRRILWQAAGKTGARTETLLDLVIPALPPEPYELIVLNIGVNDLSRLRTLSRWRRDLGSVLDALRRHSPQAHIAFAGLPPLATFPLLPQPLRTVLGWRARSFDSAARRLLEDREGACHVPVSFEADPQMFSPDGFHPSPLSYRRFGEVVAEAILGEVSEKGVTV